MATISLSAKAGSHTRSTYACFASCPRGLENLLTTELATMGAKQCLPVPGGVNFEASFKQAVRMTYWSRFAGRIGLQLAKGPFSQDEDLYQLAKKVDWWNWFGLSNSFRVDLNNLGAQVKSLRFTQLRLKDGVCDGFLARHDERPNVSVEAPDVRIFAAITPSEAMIYIDLAGENLFKRGWREAQGQAPLKENLAAGLWHLACHSPATQNLRATLEQENQPLTIIDPFCGSGTLLVESLSALCDRAPGLERSFAFERLKPFNPAWASELQSEANERFNAGLDALLKQRHVKWYGSDITELMVSMTHDNLCRAGFEELLEAGLVELDQRDALTIAPPSAQGLLLTNPPYGERVRAKGADVPEDEAYARLFKEWGDLLKLNYSGWTAFIFSGDLDLKHSIGLSPKRKTPLFNGAIECRLFEIPMTRGVYRPRAADAPASPSAS